MAVKGHIIDMDWFELISQEHRAPDFALHLLFLHTMFMVFPSIHLLTPTESMAHLLVHNVLPYNGRVHWNLMH